MDTADITMDDVPPCEDTPAPMPEDAAPAIVAECEATPTSTSETSTTTAKDVHCLESVTMRRRRRRPSIGSSSSSHESAD
mmetsp:Transcript_21759/g.47396  ORF Transcript_21759/g.47396 Transcript_21759/m.47396 type:complete len:80 (+) Transcript_21759:1237-1476(+)